ncbi:MAG: hypothetical protein AAGG44_20300, partial [Planctomycetota bacterium]
SAVLLFVFRGLGTKTSDAAQVGPNPSTDPIAADLTAEDSLQMNPNADAVVSEIELEDETSRLSSQISELVKADPSRTHALVQDWLRKAA